MKNLKKSVCSWLKLFLTQKHNTREIYDFVQVLTNTSVMECGIIQMIVLDLPRITGVPLRGHQTALSFTATLN